MMNDEQKTTVQTALKNYVETFPSANAAAESLNGASPALVSQMLNGNWKLISDEAWRSIGKQIGVSKQPWTLVETKCLKKQQAYFEEAKTQGSTFALVGNPGCGKSASAKNYAEKTKNVFHLECAEYWNKKLFLKELLRLMGRDQSGNLGDMMANIISYILRLDEPLIIIDEADKLPNDVLYFFITLYNKLADNCGIVIMATGFLQTRIERNLYKKGFPEIYSRLGRKFIGLKVPSKLEIESICKANGIDNPVLLSNIFNESEGDLRRVAKSVRKAKLPTKEAA